ncbi:MAG: CBS domain-containing protein [Gammaproteobacteria bacterium]|nr:CBS domain-containing protein [Gammaproteobacteria bacterium]
MSSKRILRVSDIMRTDVHTVDGLATVSEAMALMRRHDVRSLVVPRRDDDDEFGLILVSDIASKVIAENRAPERVNVYEVMSKPVLTLPSGMQARYAVRLLVRFGVSRAVVVGHDRNPVGIATLRDLVLGHVQE